MLCTFCRRRRLPFQFAPQFSAGFVRSRWGLPKRLARALVGFSLLRRFRLGGDELCPDRWRVARFQLFDRAGGLRNQSGTAHCESLAHRVGDRVARRNRWPVSFLLVGPAVWSGHRLHLRRVVNSYLVYRSVASPQTDVVEALAE